MKYSVIYNNKTIEFTHQINKRIKNIYISIDKHNNVTLKSRGVSVKEAKDLVLKKAAWILSKLNTRKVIEKPEVETETLPKIPTKLNYLGEEYETKLVRDLYTSNVRVFFENDYINIYTNPKFSEDFDRVNSYIDYFYKTQAEEKIIPLVEKWSTIMQLYPKQISFRKTQNRWGSCSSDNKLSLSTKLAKLSLNEIEYVIVHELAHIKEKNHSKNFWAIVEKFLPAYKPIHKKLSSAMT